MNRSPKKLILAAVVVVLAALIPAIAWEYYQEAHKVPPRGLPTGTVYLTLPDSVAVGAMAPDFTLPKLGTDGEVRLSEFRGRTPVVLVFGSFSCNIFSRQILPLEQLYHKYDGQAAFLFVNIFEAGHPEDYLKPFYTDFRLGESVPQRRERTLQLLSKLNITMPAVIDGSDEGVNKAYTSFPTRLVVVARDGKVVFNDGINSDYYLHIDKFDARLGAYLRDHP
jgi:hypothetical protein